jgi:hypothetical protein
MIQINETKVHNVRKNTHREIIVQFIIKPEDYTLEMENKLYDLKNDGTLLALAFQEIE